MATLSGLMRLYIWHMKLSLSRAMIYRFDFLTNLLISIIVSGLGPLVQYIFFTQTRGYPGWTLDQILLFQGILLLWFGIRELLFGDLRHSVMQMVWKGEFDRLLLKPYPPIGVLLCSGFQLNGIGSCIAGLTVTSLAFHRLHIDLTFTKLLMMMVSLVCGVILFMAVNIFYSAIVIMIVQMGRIDEMFDRITDFGNYPTNIFPVALRMVMVTFLPFAIWTYYPAQILLGRLDSLIWAASVCCVALFWLSIAAWNRCLRNYTSAGG
ncbi:ABC-2 type transport system permease protein [Paenibacillus sophorae]|uniref:ABC-2 family transporter protein n=1 Tax=Paenibacillus sophorae TaxID=1333845 RepID=A0A1H8N9E5_9BACL|nr:ABC-2 family transporter protein [Paenibacillus sophorae]QWU14725.1 ABC-2 family transporter protein [Paenibacillus sophorae]SEO26156.1 ABC-2 type transport system permease protein [Paenibacillus sophorae]